MSIVTGITLDAKTFAELIKVCDQVVIQSSAAEHLWREGGRYSRLGRLRNRIRFVKVWSRHSQMVHGHERPRQTFQERHRLLPRQLFVSGADHQRH